MGIGVVLGLSETQTESWGLWVSTVKTWQPEVKLDFAFLRTGVASLHAGRGGGGG